MDIKKKVAGTNTVKISDFNREIKTKTDRNSSIKAFQIVAYVVKTTQIDEK